MLTVPPPSSAGKSFSLTGISGNLISVPTAITLQSLGLILLGTPEVSSWWAHSHALFLQQVATIQETFSAVWYWGPAVLESWMMKCLIHVCPQSHAVSSLK